MPENPYFGYRIVYFEQKKPIVLIRGIVEMDRALLNIISDFEERSLFDDLL